MAVSVYIVLSLGAVLSGQIYADPEFCSRGFKIASRFSQCWDQSTFENKYPPLYEPHEYLDGKFLEDYATHMCSVTKPHALKCLKKEIKECKSNIDKIMDMADKSGGACSGNRLNPYFKTYVTDRLQSVKGDSSCFGLSDDIYECYKQAGQSVMHMSQGDDIVYFHRIADKIFSVFWACTVKSYKANEKVCPNWQLPMLLNIQRTAMPTLFGLKLTTKQVQNLELGLRNSSSSGASTLKPMQAGPSKLFLSIQLHKSKPEVAEGEEAVVLEISDLNDDNPHLDLEEGKQRQEGQALSLKQIKKMLREQRRRNKELKEFIEQAKGDYKKKQRKSKSLAAKKRERMVADQGGDPSRGSQTRLNDDIMIA